MSYGFAYIVLEVTFFKVPNFKQNARGKRKNVEENVNV